MAAGLLLLDGALGLRGWQWLFIVEGALTCLCGLLLRVRAILMHLNDMWRSLRAQSDHRGHTCTQAASHGRQDMHAAVRHSQSTSA